ncbi:MAG TPA: carbonic anhydrase [Thermoanaerobaculia bacterium]|nr:carbonic anhydrase [Thermoanaerobaculia bacterium]
MRRALAIFLFAATAVIAQQPQAPPAAPLRPPERGVTAQQLWAALLQANQAYVNGRITYDNLKAERQQLADHQLPPVTVLSCSDSRVPPELVFNQSLGVLFVVRGAGNVVDDFGLASIEYAIAQGYTQLIVVLGHENCGAVKASLGVGGPNTPALTALATRIRASFVGIPYSTSDPANVKKAVEANTRASAAYLLAASPLIREAVTSNRIQVVTAYYEMESGLVKRIE